jgi:hypothetical protein
MSHAKLSSCKRIPAFIQTKKYLNNLYQHDLKSDKDKSSMTDFMSGRSGHREPKRKNSLPCLHTRAGKTISEKKGGA